MKDDCDRPFDRTFQHESDRRLEGLSGVKIDLPGSGWPLGGSKTRMESSASKDTSYQISGLFDFIFPFLSPLSIFSFFLVFVAILLLLLLPLRTLLLLLLWPLLSI